MIIGSLVLILVAAGLIVAGLVFASNWLLAGAILACVVAAVLVYAGSRLPARAAIPAAGRTAETSIPVQSSGGGFAADQPDWRLTTDQYAQLALDDEEDDREAARSAEVVTAAAGVSASKAAIPAGHVGGTVFAGPGNSEISDTEDEEEDTPETTARDSASENAIPRSTGEDEAAEYEPPAQEVTASVRSRLARVNLEVLVVDGRPRYHLAGCVHLVNLSSEPLPVSEAQALGFTPCALCEPATTLGSP